ncbi:hypothetical protein HG536_0F04560 [Torulaspora globosa]|uniref:Zn(2)-C6 fungal-type domain-containing protein n=1 Tax=Torulaspora globosa TaxID=48254 RepID=A0A7G3ZKU4_9SACH|nr:uncharacterized protein HG536_0F04560 [Torulaspora globosa]QLL34130.1 hypothetical protein HG536_0F04560 [Torulaspora globosa]
MYMQPLGLDSGSGSTALGSLEEGQMPPSSGADAHTKKRNRISFVCQACRRSKTKCDREKPRCSRCVQHGIQCVYDVEQQPAPKNPSKDATIARLEKEVAYWKSKAQDGLNKEQHYTGASKRLRESSYPSGTQQAKKVKGWPAYGVPDLDDIQVNLYRTHPCMIMNRVMKREVKPLSENYAITQDPFLSGLIAAVFLGPSNNTMIPALSANASVSRALPSVRDNVSKLKEKLISQCHNEAQKARINEFTERILQNNTKDRVRVGMLPNAMRSSFDRNYLEDICPSNGDYSEALKSFILEMQEILPPLKILNSYKAHFYECVFPDLPFLNKQHFEESLASTLFEDEDDPTKIKIKLGRSRLRSKMENLCILLVILKLSYISLLFLNEGAEEMDSDSNRDVINKYPIGNETILLAENVLSAENLFACANENIITCLLYIWSFFIYSPEEGDFFLEHPTDVLTGVIVMLASSIGLHRDPSDFPRMCELEDPSVIIHRRTLWIAVITTVCLESSLKGRHALSLDTAMDQFMNLKGSHAMEDYMRKIKRDKLGQDAFEIRVHELCLKRSFLALLIYDMDKLSLTYRGSFNLGEMEELRGRIEDFLAETFDTRNLEKAPDGAIHETTEFRKSNMGKAQNSIGLHSVMMSRVVLLRASMALFYHFESAAIENSEQLPLYGKYLVRVCSDALTLISFITKYFGDGYKSSLLPSYCYNITKGTQIALSSTFFGMLGIIMRIEMANNIIFCNYQDEASNNSDHLQTSNQKMETLKALKMDLESALESVYRVASKHLRFTYFSVFKMLALFDVIIQRMKKGELWNTMLRLRHVEKMNQRSVKALSMALALDLDGRGTVISQLKKRNHLVRLPAEHLSAIFREVRGVIDGENAIIPKQESAASYPAFSDRSLAGNNVNLGNFDKLFSAAALSQNVDIQSSSLGTCEASHASNDRAAANNDARLINDHKNDLDLASAVPMDFPGLFGGLDLFDYDFLFSNDG